MRQNAPRLSAGGQAPRSSTRRSTNRVDRQSIARALTVVDIPAAGGPGQRYGHNKGSGQNWSALPRSAPQVAPSPPPRALSASGSRLTGRPTAEGESRRASRRDEPAWLGDYTKVPPRMQAKLHAISKIARFYTDTGRSRAFRNACHSGRRSSATETPQSQVFSLVRRFHITSSGSARSRSSRRNASGDRTVSPGAH